MNDIETAVCTRCGDEYNQLAYKVGDLTVAPPSPYCYKCRSDILNEEQKRIDKVTKDGVNNQRDEWRKSCGIPKKFMAERFKTFKQQLQPKAYNSCVRYAGDIDIGDLDKQKSLVLLSPGCWGVGKTHLATSIIHSILDKWVGEYWYCPVLFVSEPVLFLRLRASYNNSGEKEADIIKDLINTKILVIDDIGKEEIERPLFVQRTLFSIINGRYDAQLPVILTANLSLDGLGVHLGGARNNEASWDRLIEMAEFVPMSGKSYRGSKNGN